MNQILIPNSLLKIALTDFVVLLFVLLIPSFFHLFPFPGYYIEPMRLGVLFSYALSKSNINAMFLAVLIPILTMIVSGHPPLVKTILISIELFINIFVFIKLSKYNVFGALFTSIIISKIIYYILKFSCINLGMIDGSLITIAIWVQLLVAAITSILFGIYFKLGKEL